MSKLEMLADSRFLYGLAAALSVPALALTGLGVMQSWSGTAEAAATTGQDASGHWVYLDEEGNRIPRPAGATVPSPKLDRPETGETRSGAGGVGIRNPRISYTYAVKHADGAVDVHCTTVDRNTAGNGGMDAAHQCGAACAHKAPAAGTVGE